MNIKKKSQDLINFVKSYRIFSAFLLISLILTFSLVTYFMYFEINGNQIRKNNTDHILQNCQKDMKRYKWLDCSKLEIEPAYSDIIDDIPNYCTDSWFVLGLVRNSSEEILWSNFIETDRNGNLRSEEYGSSYHPDTLDDPSKDPTAPNFDDFGHHTSSPCLDKLQ